MKKLIYGLRENNIFYFISVIIVFIFLIFAMALTSVSLQWGQRLIIVGLFILIYLTVFLGVNPILKGVSLTLLHLVTTIAFTALLEQLLEQFVPNDLYQKWFEDDTRFSIGGGNLFIVLAIILKFLKIKPYIKELEKKEDEKRQQ
jgi:hypothetical protein